MNLREHIAHIWNLRGAFRRAFLAPDGKPTADGLVVLAELRRFCYGAKPTIKQGKQGLDPYASIAAAARQEVYFRIVEMLNLDDSDLRAMERRAQLEDSAE